MKKKIKKSIVNKNRKSIVNKNKKLKKSKNRLDGGSQILKN